jgi:hypothetical protein
MRRFLSRWWVESCLLVPLLTCGCQHSQPCQACCGAPNAVRLGAPIATPAGAAGAGAAPAVGNVSAMPRASTVPPIIHTAAKPALPDPADPIFRQTSAPPAPRFGHDPNYRWLVGTVEYCRFEQAWLLRYVSVEEDDRYGGCVTLVASDPKIRFKAGQTVRVEGDLIDPNSQQMQPAFQVQSLRAE